MMKVVTIIINMETTNSKTGTFVIMYLIGVVKSEINGIYELTFTIVASGAFIPNEATI